MGDEDTARRLVGADDDAKSRAVQRWLGGPREFALGTGNESRRKTASTSRLTLDEAPRGYAMFRQKEDNCEKVVLIP